MITRRGRPVADLVPHRAAGPRWVAPAEVLEIRKIAAGDPTFADDLRKLRDFYALSGVNGLTVIEV